MGFRPEARKHSKVAMKILERLLKAGEKEVSTQLINSVRSNSSSIF